MPYVSFVHWLDVGGPLIARVAYGTFVAGDRWELGIGIPGNTGPDPLWTTFGKVDPTWDCTGTLTLDFFAAEPATCCDFLV